MIRAAAALALAAALAAPVTHVASAAAEPTPVPYHPLPASYDDLPLGPPTTVPWWQRGVLHVGSTTVRTRLRDLTARAGTTLVGGGWDSSDRRSTLSLVRGGTLHHLPVRGHTRGPEISADGHWVAWLDEQAQPRGGRFARVRYRLVLFDATTRRIVADHRETRRVEVEDGGNGLRLVSVADTGQVLFARGDRGPHVLGPGRRPVRLRGVGSRLREVDGWPLGVTLVSSRHGEERGRYGSVSRHGRFHLVGVTSTAYGVWSPDAEGFAFDLDGPRRNTYWVEHPGSGTLVQLGLPTDRDELVVSGWENPTTVLLWEQDQYAAPPVSQLVRCDATTGSCERVDGGPVAGRPAVLAGP